MPFKRLLLLLSCVMLCGCAAYLSRVKDPFQDIPVFARVDDGLYRGSYPKDKGYERLYELGVKTIINLSPVKDDRFYLEQEEAEKFGFKIVHIPLSVYVWPEEEKVLTFLKTVLDKQAGPVYVHCYNGRDLTGAMIAVYRVIVQGWGPKEGYKEALTYGFWPYRGEVVLKDYIHQLKDRKAFYDLAQTYKKNNP